MAMYLKWFLKVSNLSISFFKEESENPRNVKLYVISFILYTLILWHLFYGFWLSLQRIF